MAAVLNELVPFVALKDRVARGRRKRACCAWMSLAAAVRWRKVKVRIGCFQAWQAFVAQRRAAAAKARVMGIQLQQRWAFRTWKTAYLQVRASGRQLSVLPRY